MKSLMVQLMLYSENADKQSKVLGLFIWFFDNKMVLGDCRDFWSVEDEHFYSVCDWITEDYDLQQQLFDYIR